MNANAKSSEQKKVERHPVKLDLDFVQYSKLRFIDRSFREDEQLLPVAIATLAADIAKNGLGTPLIVRPMGDGTFGIYDGTRRKVALEHLVQTRDGFSTEMLVPVQVMAAETNEADALRLAAGTNFARLAHSPLERSRFALAMLQAGNSIADIAESLQVSESTLRRDLAVVSNDELLQQVRAHEIAATDAAAVAKLATDKGRMPDLLKAIAAWVTDIKEEIRREEARRAAQDDKPLSAVQRWPQRYMTREQIGAWKIALERDEPLERATFKYRVVVREDKVEIASLSADPREMPIADLAKVVLRLSSGAEQLEGILQQRWELEKLKEKERDAGQGSLPGSAASDRLRQMGIDEQIIQEALIPDEAVAPEYVAPEQAEEAQS
ncbi:MAG TPA: ParB N-terminal domain-containing protein [Pirellulales bacterium]|jgi:ParB-like chromosome segregation protein Spo0J|nr:ParB N-terminal domain-containing protein [Pirellulales bacterium]